MTNTESRVRNVLASFPWQEYGYKYGRWQRVQALFDLVKGPREFWLVDNAKHNQAFHLAAEEYQRRVLDFFDKHLGGKKNLEPSANGARDTAVMRKAE